MSLLGACDSDLRDWITNTKNWDQLHAKMVQYIFQPGTLTYTNIKQVGNTVHLIRTEGVSVYIFANSLENKREKKGYTRGGILLAAIPGYLNGYT